MVLGVVVGSLSEMLLFILGGVFGVGFGVGVVVVFVFVFGWIYEEVDGC